MSPRRFPRARVTLPPSASSWPVRMRKRVVFPAPFFPRMPTRSPVSEDLEGGAGEHRLAHLVFFL